MKKKNKYRSALVQKAKEDLAYEKEQRDKRKELNIEDENVIIVEKSNNYKFTINSIKALVKLISRILIIILCTIGLMGLIFPAPRSALFMIINEALGQLHYYLDPLFMIIKEALGQLQYYIDRLITVIH